MTSDLTAAIYLESGTSLIDCAAAGLRLLTACNLYDSNELDYQPDWGHPPRDLIAMPKAQGGSITIEVVKDRETAIRIKAGLFGSGMGELDLTLHGYVDAPRNPNGKINGPATLAMFSRIGQRLQEAARIISADPKQNRLSIDDIPNSLKSLIFGHLGQDPTLAQAVAAALISREIDSLGLNPELKSFANVVLSLHAYNDPLAVLRFDLDAEIKPKIALTPEGMAVLAHFARPSMALSIDDKRVHIRPVKTLPASIDNKDDPMIALRAERALQSIGPVPTNILTEEAIKALFLLQEKTQTS